MGGTRFVVGALQQIMLAKVHHCRVALVEAEADASSAAPSSVAATEGSVLPSPSSAAPGSLASSSQQHSPVAAWPPPQQPQQQQQQAAEGPEAAGLPPGPPLRHIIPLLQQLRQEQRGQEERLELGGEEQELPPGWQRLPGSEVQLWAACNLPWLDMNFNLAPEAGLHTGAWGGGGRATGAAMHTGAWGEGPLEWGRWGRTLGAGPLGLHASAWRCLGGHWKWGGGAGGRWGWTLVKPAVLCRGAPPLHAPPVLSTPALPCPAAGRRNTQLPCRWPPEHPQLPCRRPPQPRLHDRLEQGQGSGAAGSL